MIEAAVELGPPEPTPSFTATFICDISSSTAGAAAVIDWIDLSYNSPGVDLVLYWSVLPAEGRPEFREAYGTITEDQLLCARILALFISAARWLSTDTTKGWQG